MPFGSIIRWGDRQKPVSKLKIPRGYRKRAAWLPHVGDIFPRFTAASTHGEIDFFDWSEGKWTVLFNQAEPGGSVGSTELAAFALAGEVFSSRRTQLLGLICADLDAQMAWQAEIKARFETEIRFPVLLDEDRALSTAFGMSHWKDGWHHAVRKTFVISPSLHVRCILEYPMNLGRSLAEIARILDAQQLHACSQLVTGADWVPGEPAIVPIYMPQDEASKRYGATMFEMHPGMRIVETSR